MSTQLRWLSIAGPDVTFANQPAQPLWQVQIGAPFRDATAWIDKIHPVRVLAQAGPAASVPRLVAPRHLQAGVIAGAATNWPAAPTPGYEILGLANATGGQHRIANRQGFAVWQTVHDLAQPPEDWLQPVLLSVIEPRPGSPPDWPAQPDANITVPPMRLTGGALRLTLAADQNPVLAALTNLFGGQPNASIALTPHGIELAGQLPFPGTPIKLPGRFLLAPGNNGGLVLRLLTDTPEADAWMEAWRALQPPAATAGGYATLRLRQTGRAPAFFWQVAANGTGLGQVGSDIGFGAEDATLLLSGTLLANGKRDGVVSVRGAVPVLSGTANSAVFDLDAGLQGQPAGPATFAYSYAAPAGAAAIHGWSHSTGPNLSLVTDELALAAALRAAHGLPAPAARPTADDPAPPLLFGFTPLRDGWLQFPVPNLPLPNPDDDSAAPPPAAPRASGLDGFIRLSNFSPDPALALALALEARWTCLLAAADASAARVELAIIPPAPAQAAAAAARIAAIDARFTNPALVLGGIFWTSLDPPSAADALPRPSASPAALRDIPLTNGDATRSQLVFTLPKLEIALPAGQPPTIPPTGLKLALSWRQDPQSRFAKLIGTRPALAEKLAAMLDFMGCPWTPPAKAPASSPDAVALAIAVDEAAQLEATRLRIEAKLVAAGRSQAERNVLQLQRTKVLLAQDASTAKLPTLKARADREWAGAPAAPAMPPAPRAIVWRAHPTQAFAATLPMTRGDTAGPLANESRELAPFTVNTGATGALCLVATLAWDSSLAAALPDDAELGALLPDWPVAPIAGTLAIGFTPLSVPGVIVLPGYGADPVHGWKNAAGAVALHVGYRLDLPLLDEPFAHARLPQIAPPDSDAPPDPPAYAYDPASLGALWAVRSAELALSEVQASTLVPLQALGANPAVPAPTLLAPYTLQIAADYSDGPPFGSVTVAGQRLTDTAALKGLSGSLTIPAGGGPLAYTPPAGALPPTGITVALTGWTPAIYGLGIPDGPQIDNRGLAVWPFVPTPTARRRPAGDAAAGSATISRHLLTLPAQLNLAGGLEFWFRDLPFTANNGWVFARGAAPAVDCDPFSPASVATNGYEWRLYDPATPSDSVKMGIFSVTPLRLLTVNYPAGAPPDGSPASFSILAALRIGASEAAGPVTLTWRPDGAGSYTLAAVATPAPLSLRLLARCDWYGDEARCAVDVSFTLTATAGQLTVANLTIAFALFGVAFKAALAVTAPGVYGAAPADPNPTPGRAVINLTAISLDTAARTLAVTPRLLLTPENCAQPALSYDLAARQPGVLNLLGFNSPIDASPTGGATTPAIIISGATELAASTDLFAGWPIAEELRCMVVMGLAPTSAPAGTSCPIGNGYAAFTADTASAVFACTGDVWTGTVYLRTPDAFSFTSMIQWPTATVAPAGSPNGWRLTTAGPARTHNVTLVLDGQSFPVSALDGGQPTWPIAAPLPLAVSVFHSFGDDKSPFTWRSLDTVVLQAAASFAKPDPGSLAFGAAYLAGNPRFMQRAGIGALDHLIGGPDGVRFQAAWAALAPPPDGLILSGAFSGMLQDDTLLRLPWIARAGGTGANPLLTQAEQPIELNWFDLAPARFPWPGRLPAPPSDATAIRALYSTAVADGTSVDVVASLEQTMRATPYPPQATLTECFWPAALAALTQLTAKNLPRAALLLLTDGRVLATGTPPRPHPATARPPQPCWLLSAGRDGGFSRTQWNAPRPADDAKAAALLDTVSRLRVLHAEPLYGVIAGPDAQGDDGTTVIALPPPFAPPRPVLAAAEPAKFAEAQRGWPFPPSALPWLEDGAAAAVQLDELALSGLAVARGLPGRIAAFRGEPATWQTQWLWERLAPARAAQPYATLAAPPLPERQASPARLFLPRNEDVRDALNDLSGTQDWNGFLPPSEHVLLTGARPGAMMVRQAGIAGLAGAGTTENWPFGRPGETGPVAPVQMRMPRPVGLLPNVGDLALDCRLRAAAQAFTANCEVRRGPADALWDTDWTVTFTLEAAGATPGLIGVSPDPGLSLVLTIRRTAPAEPGAAPPQPATMPVAFIELNLRDLLKRGRAVLAAAGVEIPVAKLNLALPPTPAPPPAPQPPPAWTRIAGNPGGWQATACCDVLLQPATGNGIADLFAAARTADGRLELRLRFTPGTGTDRPPISMVLPLAVIDPTLPGLCMQPLTVLFSDPEYDRTLANQPLRTPGKAVGVVPSGPRGRIIPVLYTGRSAYCADETIEIMADLTHEIPFVDPADRSVKPDGDYLFNSGGGPLSPTALLDVTVLSARGVSRQLLIGTETSITITLATPVGLAIPALREQDASPYRPAPGDRLQLHVGTPPSISPIYLTAGDPRVPVAAQLESATGFDAKASINVTAFPSIDPPGALYAALMTRQDNRVAMPLFAQSPFPSRIDAPNLKADMRAGLINRSALFVWPTTCPADEVDLFVRLFVLKQNKSGRAFLPGVIGDFIDPT